MHGAHPMLALSHARPALAAPSWGHAETGRILPVRVAHGFAYVGQAHIAEAVALRDLMRHALATQNRGDALP